MSNVFRRSAKQVFKLNRTELFDDSGLLRDALLEPFFELMKFSFLFIQVFDQTASSLLHFVETALQADPVRSLVPLSVLDFVICDGILRVPHIMSDKLFNGNLPRTLQFAVVDILDLSHEAIDILNQNIITRDQDSFLLLLLLSAARVACSATGAARVEVCSCL